MTRLFPRIVALVLLLAARNESPPVGSTPAAPGARPLVVASFHPAFEFAHQVAGGHAEVVALVPPGMEPHDREPSPQDMARLEKARLFVYKGAGLEPWAERLAGNLPAGGAIVLAALLILASATFLRRARARRPGAGA